ncbi:LamG-like jellyroll fold domain-containing protein [Reichenbachiella agariperforans]|uniref:LamG-like jellyroll fold domain-containing protein n=1 Tax=Reichenbachiella agariperforans TaxID=156994 RepID=UPI001C0A117A|nr:LamG-like jellyroll fold domain-containing protein [Reichenbachiella agariperforans]MBU2916011.1 T9SS type A sorting domain-containing protein [Reichenbachiella agariperforans]
MKLYLSLFFVLIFAAATNAQSPFSEYLFTNGALQNTGSTENSLTQTGDALIGAEDRDGFANSALSLNGDILQEQSGVNRTNFSVSFWIKTSTNDANPRYILDQWGGNPGGKGPIGYRVILENGELSAFGKFYVYNQNIHFVSNNINTAGGTIADGQWHHVVLTMSAWSRATLNGNFPNVSHRLYVDNVLQQLTTVEIPTAGGTGRTVDAVPLSIGNIQDQSAEFSYEDQIDDIRMYNKKLEDAEIATIYNQRTSLAKIYVKSDAAGNNDGSSWADAFTSLKAATDYATASGDTIWVAQGTYKADASDRTASFVLQKGVKLFGGFVGTETQLSERNWRANPTILSGDLNGDDDNDISYTNALRSENTYRIVYVAGDNTLIDGVIITGGQANNTANNDYNRGAAIFKSSDAKNLTIKNTIIRKNVSNREGNIHVLFTSRADNTLRVENCIVSNNFARYGGGFAASVENGATLDAKVYNSLFFENVAGDVASGDGFAGSSLYFAANAGQIDVAVINSTFTDNKDLGTNTSNDKGTIVIRRLNNDATSIAHATLHNNIFYNNLSSPVVVNEQVIGFMNRPTNKLNSLTFTYNISNQTDFSTKANAPVVSDNINQDPLFTDAISQDFTLFTGSPAIDAGSNDQLPGDLFGDLQGNKRIHAGTIDMGVYESGSSPRNLVAPTAIAQDITVELGINGEVTVAASQVDNGSTDDDTADNELIFSLDKAIFTCEDLGANTVTLTVKDASRNIATAEAIVTVTSNIDDEAVTIAEDTGCDEMSTTVTTGSSVSGINYFLRNSTDNSIVEGPILGTGESLDFNTGTVTGNTTFNVYGEVPPVNSISGGLDFDGTNDRVATTYTMSTTSTFTLEAWIFPRGTSWSRLFSNMNYSSLGSTAGDFIVDTYGTPDNGRNVRFTLDGEASDIQLYAHQSLTLNEWNHIAVTFDNGVAKILVNGAEVASENNPTVTRILGSSRPVHLGVNGGASPVKYFDGKMDEFRIWNVAKTAAEISEEMDNCLRGTESGLSAYFNFEDGEGTQLTEIKAGKNGTLVNFDEAMAWAEGPELSCGTGCGFQMTEEVTLTVGDETAPTAVAKDITVGLNPNGEATISAIDINDGSSDNCTADEDLELSIDQTLFVSSNLGENTVILTVTDASGNESTAETTVTVTDNLLPTAIAQNLTIQLDTDGHAAITPAQINNGSKDNSTATGDLVLTLSHTAFTCADVGSNTVTLTVEDASGNQSTATATVTVEDKTLPTAIAQDFTAQLDGTGNVVVSPLDVNNGSSDSCTESENLTLALDQAYFDCTQLGAHTVTLTVVDESGNLATTTATVTVEDSMAPVMATQDITVNLSTDGTAVITPADVDDASSDNCGDVTLSLDIDSFTTANVGANTVTLTGTDAQGNVATATAVVTVVDRAEQTISITEIEDKLTTDDPFNVIASTTSGLDLTYAVDGPASIVGSEITLDGTAGMVTVTVSQAGNENYKAASEQITFDVSDQPKSNQTITFDSITDKVFGDEDFAVTATASSGLDVTYSVISGPATVTGHTVSITGAGTVELAADQLGDDQFNAAPQVTQSFTVAKSDQTITVTAIENKLIGDSNFDVIASTTSSLALTYEVSGPATISGTTITLDGTIGVITVTVSQAGNNNFNATSEQTTFNVSDPAKTIQTITFETISDKVFGDADFDITATASSGLDVTYSVISGPAVVAGHTVSITGAGTVEIAADQLGNDQFNAASQVTQSFTVAKADQTITVTAIENKLVDDLDFEVIANTTSSLALIYTVSGPATINGTTITLDGTIGVVTITVSQAGNDNYNSAETAVSFEVTEKGTSVLAAENEVSFQVYPNPATSTISIEGVQSADVKIQIFDARGQEISVEKSFGSDQISIRHLESGLYFMKITDQNITTTTKLLVRR